MTEKLIFRMPSNVNYFLAALCVLEAYQKMCSLTPTWTAEFYLSNVSPDLNWLLEGRDKWQWTKEEAINAWMFKSDLYFEFDIDKTYRLSTITEMHVVKTFGVMLGCEPMTLYPNLLHFIATRSGTRKNVMTDTEVLPDAVICKQWYDVGLHHKQWSGKFDLETLREIQDSVLVIGKVSPLTYAAAALGKPLVELYPSHFHKNWFTKYTAGNYYLVPEESPTGTLQRATEVAWRNISNGAK